MKFKFPVSAAALAMLCASQANAELAISIKPTSNVTCSDGVCVATAEKAVLNHDDLATMLDSGDVVVKSGSTAKNIDVAAGVAWSSDHVLTLDSYRAIAIDHTISVEGGAGAGLTMTTNDGGSGGGLRFGPTASVRFADDTNTLVINGASYHLAFDYNSLVIAIFENPGGNIALGHDIDMPSGAIEGNPISQMFTGTFEGLGHSILHLNIYAIAQESAPVGFFYGNTGSISNLHIPDLQITDAFGDQVGGLSGLCYGPIVNVEVSGQIHAYGPSQVGALCGVSKAPIIGSSGAGLIRGGGHPGGNQFMGGLVGDHQSGKIVNCHSSAVLRAKNGWTVGGLVGRNADAIVQSYTTGRVILRKKGVAGGLAGTSSALIRDSYATGSTTGGPHTTVGGLIGQNNGPVRDVYSSGAVASGSGRAVGGLIGDDTGPNDLTDTYWDTDTSGQSHGVGNNDGYPGVTGLTTAQFQAGLPAGFDPSVWAEDPSINNGLPYLLPNPQ